MKVAVVTPYFREDIDILTRCLRSVKGQTVECDHFVVADGFPQDWVDLTQVKHIKLDRSHNNFGNTPRCIGAMLAASRDYDAITFLDADNWYDRDHVETCCRAAAIAPNLDFIAARRRFMRVDQSILPWPEEPTDQLIDTNCFFLLKSSFHMIPLWGLTPTPLTMYCDRVFLAGLQNAKMNYISTDKITVNYLCTWQNVYKSLGEAIPDFAKALDEKAFLTWIASLSPDAQEIITRRLGFSINAEPNVYGYKFYPIPRIR